MWWPEIRPLARAAVLAAAGLALAACGFQPLYGAGDGSTRVAELQQVRIAPIPERRGQQLHNELRDLLNPRGQPRDPAYRLVIRLAESEARTNLRADSTATRVTQRLTANWELQRIGATGGRRQAPVLSGRSRSFNSFDVFDQPYATTVAERDARERGVRDLARDIHGRVAAWIARGSDG